jgi:F-type H+-transporting ATPase subunit b
MRFDPWTFGLQAVNFLVLAWLLNRFLYRPVLGIIAARKAATDKVVAEAQAERTSAEALRRDLELQKSALAEALGAELSRAHDAAEAERAAILAKARREADEAQAAAQLALERQRTEAVRELGRDAARLGVSIARRLLDEPSAAAVQARLVEQICEDVRALAPDDRRRIAESIAPPSPPPIAVTAVPLDAPAQADFAARLSEALGAPVRPDWRVDPALIAGVELQFAFTILKRSWLDDLKRIQAELIHDDAQRVA